MADRCDGDDLIMRWVGVFTCRRTQLLCVSAHVHGHLTLILPMQQWRSEDYWSKRGISSLALTCPFWPEGRRHGHSTDLYITNYCEQYCLVCAKGLGSYLLRLHALHLCRTAGMCGKGAWWVGETALPSRCLTQQRCPRSREEP